MRSQRKKTETKKQRNETKGQKKKFLSNTQSVTSGDDPAEIKQKQRVKPEDISAIVEPLCEAEGIELVHIEYQREPRGRVLRLYIDKAGGISLDDCVYISRQVSDLLDVSFTAPEFEYNLEVSSPGPNRPLGKESDFERFKGNMARIRTSQPVDGQKKFYGALMGISKGIVKILINDKTVAIPFQEITRAQLVNYNTVNCNQP